MSDAVDDGIVGEDSKCPFDSDHIHEQMTITVSDNQACPDCGEEWMAHRGDGQDGFFCPDPGEPSQ